MLFGKYKKKSKFIKFKFRELITVKVFSLKVFSFIVKNVFNNNKLLKMTFITERKYYYKLKTFIIKKYINFY